MTTPTPEQHRKEEADLIKVRLVENAILVRAGAGWFSFQTWTEASKHIEARLNALKEQRVRNGA